MYRYLVLLLLPAAVAADDLPLFASSEPLEITIELPLRSLIKHAAERPVVDAVASYVDESGETVSRPIQVSTRGKSRLRACSFPPLSLSVKHKKDSKGTVFEGQKSIKLVTHCRSSGNYRNYVLKEQGIYEAFTVLTDVSFRTRRLTITYRDTDRNGAEKVEPGFLIESIGEVASRTGLERKKVPRVNTWQLEPAYATLVSMFQYMVGNTDWSAKLGPEGSNCCHNGRVLAPAGQEDGWKVVPYDFDQTGVVNADYAEPSSEFRIRSVRQRLWRGFCAHNEHLDDVAALFNERREEIESALLVPGMSRPQKTLDYIADFYKVINDPRKRQGRIDSRCRG